MQHEVSSGGGDSFSDPHRYGPSYLENGGYSAYQPKTEEGIEKQRAHLKIDWEDSKVVNGRESSRISDCGQLTWGELKQLVNNLLNDLAEGYERPTYWKPILTRSTASTPIPGNSSSKNSPSFSVKINSQQSSILIYSPSSAGKASNNDFLKLRLFTHSLTGMAFDWYTRLPKLKFTMSVRRHKRLVKQPANFWIDLRQWEWVVALGFRRRSLVKLLWWGCITLKLLNI